MAISTRIPFLLVGLISLVSANHPKTHTVHHGYSIQNAIDAAKPYDQIIVESGTYAEQLTIGKDGITLIGHNAVLVPPSSPLTNPCSGLTSDPSTNTVRQAGICITGSNIVFSPYNGEHTPVASVGRRVKDVSVSGFSVTGFDGLNVAIVGAEDTSVCDNTLTDGGEYGALTVGSKNSVIERNTVISNPPVAPNTFLRFIGICMDDVSTVTIAYNSINGYNIALCVQTNGADIHDNQVKNSCIGAYVDPGVDGAKLRNNEIKHSNPLCQEPYTVSHAFGVWGIIIAGAKNTLVKGNHISGITNGFSQIQYPAAGVAVDNDITGGPDIASGNTVADNTIKHNDVDLYVMANVTGTVLKNNDCKSSSPPKLCQ